MNIAKRIINSDQKAFEEFYLETHKKIYAFVHSRTNNRELTQEIVQGAYITLWERRSFIKPQRHYFEAYLFKIVRNAIISEYKRKIAEQQANLHFEQLRKANEEPEIFVVEEDEDQRNISIDDILDNLPHRQRQVFQMIKIEGFTNQEVADKLDISKRTVESHLHQATIMLRKKLT